jgi:hypothetical protein
MVSGTPVSTRFGRGWIVRIAGNFAIVAIERMGGLELNVPIAELSSEETISQPVQPNAAPNEDLAATLLPDLATAATDPTLLLRRDVEALRFGIVPSTSLADLTLGYDRLAAWIRSRLHGERHNAPSFSEVSGAFGTGKSHTMAVIRSVAEQDGFATAHVEIDGRSVSLTDPSSIATHLFRTLRIPEHRSATPVVDLNLRAAARGHAAASQAVRLYERVWGNYLTVQTLSRGSDPDSLLEEMDALMSGINDVTINSLRSRINHTLFRDGIDTWAQGNEVHPKRLIGSTVAERPRDFMDSLLGYAHLAHLGDCKGVVVTIDEFEVEHVGLTPSGRERLERMVSVIATYLSGRFPEHRGPLSIFVGTVAQEGYAGDAVVSEIIDPPKSARYELPEWTAADHRELAKRIHALYCRAYSLQSPYDPSIAKAVERQIAETDVHGSGLIRAFIKRYVAELDSRYGPPEFNGT